MIQYRTFRNPDPPGLLEVWNSCCTGRAAAPFRVTTLLEYFTFAKPYFDPDGLIVAVEDTRIVGYVHAGFGSSADGTALDRQRGVTCTIGVLPSHRRQGIGSELLTRAEEYLQKNGATDLVAGPMAPSNPFSFGLYGGAGSPGFLASDALARPFFENRGYAVERTTLVLQRPLDRVQIPGDARFAAHRQRYEIHARPAPARSWWRECVIGPVELVEYRLQEKGNGKVVARATLWEMDTFSQAWNDHAVGIFDLEVVPDMRRQGLARFLLAQIVRHLHEQYFTLVEAQTEEKNEGWIALLQGLNFTQIDAGYEYRRIG